MDPYKTPGAFSWNELSTPDPEAAGRFYAGLFGWTVKNMDMGTGPYHVASLGDTQVCGIMALPPEAGPMPPAWGCYITWPWLSGLTVSAAISAVRASGYG